MNAGLLDIIVGTFVVALDGAFAALTRYSIPLLAIVGLIYFLIAVGQMTTVGNYSLAALGDVLWIILKWGVLYWIVFVLYDLFWNGAFMTFLQWGLEAGGGTFGLDAFLRPSAVVDAGVIAAGPIYDYLNNLSGMGAVWNLPTAIFFVAAFVLIIVSFAVMALHVMMTIIEFKLAVATATVLIPWAVLTQTAVFGELALSWLAAGLVRVMLTAIMMSIGVPLFELFAFPGGSPASGGSDPTIYQAIAMSMGALVFAVLAWVLPSRAAAIGGRGMALAIGGDSLVAGGMAGYAIASRAVGGAIRGTSRLLGR
jgi:type IV secretion system protein TrbL